jgi:hypothetical protein
MAPARTVTLDGGQVRDALVRQWRVVAQAIPGLDLDAPSRIVGWRNREVLAHLYAQPLLLDRFMAAATDEAPRVDVAANLSGTNSFSRVVDTLARQGADMGKAQDRIRRPRHDHQRRKGPSPSSTTS